METELPWEYVLHDMDCLGVGVGIVVAAHNMYVCHAKANFARRFERRPCVEHTVAQEAHIRDAMLNFSV